MIRLAQKHRAARKVDGAVVPMINIVFLLLLYFLVAGRITEQEGPAIQLPIGSAERQPLPITLTVHVTTDDQLSINGRDTDEEALRGAFAAIANLPGHHVLIRADARASAAALHRIMAAGDAVGLASFELATLKGG